MLVVGEFEVVYGRSIRSVGVVFIIAVGVGIACPSVEYALDALSGCGRGVLVLTAEMIGVGEAGYYLVCDEKGEYSLVGVMV